VSFYSAVSLPDNATEFRAFESAIHTAKPTAFSEAFKIANTTAISYAYNQTLQPTK
jgi:hypothetical protein